MQIAGRQAAMATGATRYPDAAVHFYGGPVGSGKTLMTLLDFFGWVATQPPGRRYGILAPTLGRVTAMLQDHQEIFRYRAPRTGTTTWMWNGCIFELRFTEGISAAARIRGANWAGALVDEGTLGHREALAQAQARLRVGERPKMWIATNPAGPQHWLRQQFLVDKPADVHVVESQVYDNPALPPGYVESLERVFHGPMRERMVYGRWVAAAGEIWEVPPDTVPPDGPPKRVLIGVDDAASGTAFGVALGQWEHDGPWWAIGEWEKKAGERTTVEERAESLFRWAHTRWPDALERIYVDPSAVELIRELRRLGLRAQGADNAVLRGLQVVEMLFGSGRLHPTRAAAKARISWEEYAWDPAAESRGEDRPKKDGQEHACDALRYACMAIGGRRVAITAL